MSKDKSVAYEAWRWRKLLADLDRAGYRVVAKPTLLDVGKPAQRPS